MEPEQYKEWLSAYCDYDECVDAFNKRKQFFRVNTIKMPLPKFAEISHLKCRGCAEYDAAYELEEAPGYELGRTWEYFLGYIYPQSLPSILVSLILGPKSGETV